MKNVNQLIAILISIAFVTACQDVSPQEIVQEETVEQYLTREKFVQSSGLQGIEDNIKFWKKELSKDPNSITDRMKLAGAYANRFQIKGDVSDLHQVDSLYNVVLNQPGGKTAARLQAAAQLSITKHHFKPALNYSLKALEIGDQKDASLQLLFDSLMEIGDYQLAKKYLDRFKNEYNFGFMLRMSKYKDHEGQLDSAIHYMEKAAELVDHDDNLYAWSLSNLGDMYGHAGKVQKSYDHYLKVLGMNNSRASYLHVLEGFAWIAYSHDKNLDLAKRILKFVKKQSQLPDVNLTLAEIAEYEDNPEKKEEYLRAFVKEVQKTAYFGMYNSYLAELATTDLNNYKWASDLIDKELASRPTPQIYSLKAWNKLHSGYPEKALQIVQNHVEGRTYEPVPTYRIAKIYQANGMIKKAQSLYRELVTSKFELGPVMINDIQNELKAIS